MAVSAPSSCWRGLVVGLVAGAVIGGAAFMLGGGLLWLLALPLGAGAGVIAPAVKPPLCW
jgi:hypothetical protein